MGADVLRSEDDLPALCLKANTGSSWSALVIAINVRPDSLAELLRVIGVPSSGKYRERAFDAAADAWRLYEDAQDQGALPV